MPVTPAAYMEVDDEDEHFEPTLFSNISSNLVSFIIGSIGVEQSAICSKASTTAHDETGTIIWPISVLLAWYIAEHPHEFTHRGQILELGAGCALPGLIASRFCSQGVLLTDGNDLALDLLRQNATRQIQKGLSAGPLTVKELLWGSETSLEAALEGGKWKPQILIASDVVCWPDYVRPLLETVKALFLQAPDILKAILYLGYVNRAASTERLLYHVTAELGLCIRSIDPDIFLPDTRPDSLRSREHLELLVIKLDPWHPQAFTRPVLKVPEHTNAPC